MSSLIFVSQKGGKEKVTSKKRPSGRESDSVLKVTSKSDAKNETVTLYSLRPYTVSSLRRHKSQGIKPLANTHISSVRLKK